MWTQIENRWEKLKDGLLARLGRLRGDDTWREVEDNDAEEPQHGQSGLDASTHLSAEREDAALHGSRGLESRRAQPVDASDARDDEGELQGARGLIAGESAFSLESDDEEPLPGERAVIIGFDDLEASEGYADDPKLDRYRDGQARAMSGLPSENSRGALAGLHNIQAVIEDEGARGTEEGVEEPRFEDIEPMRIRPR